MLDRCYQMNSSEVEQEIIRLLTSTERNPDILAQLDRLERMHYTLWFQENVAYYRDYLAELEHKKSLKKTNSLFGKQTVSIKSDIPSQDIAKNKKNHGIAALMQEHHAELCDYEENLSSYKHVMNN